MFGIYRSFLDLSEFRSHGWEPTGELFVETSSMGETITKVIMTGPFTKAHMVRDCGDHYIVARYSRYDRIDKITLKVTKYVKDE